MKKVFSKWVQRVHIMEQKQQRVDDSQSYLSLFIRNKQDFLHRCVIMDKTWIRHFTSESKRQLAEWLAAGESCPKPLKTQQSSWRQCFGMCEV
ncbi:hypothetical protein X975_16219, partial [Stegodyphus mimosarum]